MKLLNNVKKFILISFVILGISTLYIDNNTIVVYAETLENHISKLEKIPANQRPKSYDDVETSEIELSSAFGYNIFAVSANGDLAIMHKNATINVYNVSGGFMYAVKTPFRNGVTSMTFNENNELCLQPGRSETIAVFNHEGELKATYKKNDNEFSGFINNEYKQIYEYEWIKIFDYFQIYRVIENEKIVYESGGILMTVLKLFFFIGVILIVVLCIWIRIRYVRALSELKEKHMENKNK